MIAPARYSEVRAWWHKSRPLSVAELVADGIVHGIGITSAISLGTVLIVFMAIGPSRTELPAIIVYLASLLTVLGVSLAFNLAPISGFKKLMARLDQAAIFLFIAGSYTPFLTLLGRTGEVQLLTAAIWGAALIGIVKNIAHRGISVGPLAVMHIAPHAVRAAHFLCRGLQHFRRQRHVTHPHPRAGRASSCRSGPRIRPG